MPSCYEDIQPNRYTDIIKDIKWIICKEKNFVIEHTKCTSKKISNLLMRDVYKTPESETRDRVTDCKNFTRGTFLKNVNLVQEITLIFM